MLRLIFFMSFVIISCDTEYELSLEKDPPPGPPFIIEDEPIQFVDVEPEIEVTSIRTGDFEITPGCESSGQFVVRNIGLGELVVHSADAYASVPADASAMVGPEPFPRTLSYLESFTIEIDVLASDEIDDNIIAVVKSNDSDEPIVQSNLDFGAGTSPKRTEEFDVPEGNDADILLVVDNSCSMHEEQSALSSNAERFIDSLEVLGVDYQIAVITTDSSTFVGPIVRPLDPDPSYELSQQVLVGTIGNSTEQGILMASKAMKPGGMASPGSTFMRRDAQLAVVWISDEADYSLGTPAAWSHEFWGLKSSPGKVSVWSIIGDIPYGCTTADPGYGYFELVTMMGGNWSSICSSDWGTPLGGVASTVSVDSTFELAGEPIATTIRVWVDGIETYDWAYVVADNAVSFNPGHAPDPGMHVLIEYSYIEECN
jgi:hypothetical protein